MNADMKSQSATFAALLYDRSTPLSRVLHLMRVRRPTSRRSTATRWRSVPNPLVRAFFVLVLEILPDEEESRSP